MTDIVDLATRSRMMAGIRSKGTRPELVVRSLLHRRGFRFARGHLGLSGSPDVVLPRWRVVVFVNGCFWHMHSCGLFRMPSNNLEFWKKKLTNNRSRDQNNIRTLLSDGWKVLIIWECSLRGAVAIKSLDEHMNGVAMWIRSNTKDDYCVLSGTGLSYSKYGNKGN